MRNFLTRESYIPANAREIDNDGTDAAIHVSENDERTKFHLIAFHGRAQKPDLHYYYTSDENRQRKIESYIESRKAYADRKKKHAAERAKPHSLEVGEILYTSWGYDQTNVGFFQVVEVKSPRTVVIREIAQKAGAATGPMSDTRSGVKNQFIGKAITKRAGADNCISFERFRGASSLGRQTEALLLVRLGVQKNPGIEAAYAASIPVARGARSISAYLPN